ncbi:MAG: hypothetical protein R2724_06015 [Bryobacterales bacterium]
MLFGSFATEIADTDFWWNLATGRYIAQEHELPVPDPFSYTSDRGEETYSGERRVRNFNLTHEWLAQLLGYGVWVVSGFAGLVLLKSALLTFFCGAAGWLAWRRSGSLAAGVIASLVGLPFLLLFASDRPALLTFAFVALFTLILERYRDSGQVRWLYVLPALQVLWANMHGGFFMGFVVIGAYFLDGLRESARRNALAATLAAAVVLSGLNPSGFGIFAVLSGYRQSYLTQTLIEWAQPPLWGPPYVFQILLYATAAVMAWQWRKVRICDALLFLAFGAASLLAFRNLPFVAFFAPVFLAAYTPGVQRLNARTVGGAIAGMVAALLVWQAANGKLFQLRVADWKFPEQAAHLLRQLGPEQPLFNTYEYGGYLMWAIGPEVEVFIDGRALNEAVYADYRTIIYGDPNDPGAAQRLLDHYGVDVVLMNGFEYVSGVVYPLILQLGAPSNTQWRLAHEDAQAVVFVREGSGALPGMSLAKSGVTEHLEASCRLSVEHDRELSQCARTLGFLYLRAGDAQRAGPPWNSISPPGPMGTPRRSRRWRVCRRCGCLNPTADSHSRL